MGANFSELENDSSDSEVDRKSSSSNAPRIITVKTVDEWKKKLEENKKNNNKLMVVDFTASWCIFCKIIAPAVKEYARTYGNVDFIKIDMTSPQNAFMDVARQFDVRGYPTFVMMKKGAEVGKVTGANKDELKNKIESLKG